MRIPSEEAVEAGNRSVATGEDTCAAAQGLEVTSLSNGLWVFPDRFSNTGIEGAHSSKQDDDHLGPLEKALPQPILA